LGDRITVVLKTENADKLRIIQAKMIRKSTKAVIFSHVLNLVLI